MTSVDRDIYHAPYDFEIDADHRIVREMEERA